MRTETPQDYPGLSEDCGGGEPTHLVSEVKSNVAGEEKQRLFFLTWIQLKFTSVDEWVNNPEATHQNTS